MIIKPSIILLTIIFLSIIAEAGSFLHRRPRKLSYDVPSLIRDDGYVMEKHHAVTDDGYVIELHRIPRGRNETGTNGNRKPVVFLTHCIMCSSASFVVLGPNGGLAYILANEGYDVWMLNSRGSKYSRKHTNLSPDSTKFWQFSWHEQGVYDLPASIDYILTKTGESQLDAIGFSMGTTQIFVLLSERPEYNTKMRSVTALAPAAFVGRSRSVFTVLADIPTFGDSVVNIGANSGQLEVAAETSGLKDLFSSVCVPNTLLLQKICAKALVMAGGNANGNINQKSLPFFFKFFPESTSLRSIVHFYQLYSTGRFQKYNYGRKLNWKIYGALDPPQYNLSKVTAPVNVIWSAADEVTVPRDVVKFVNSLPHVVSAHEIGKNSLSHVDFIWARSAPKLVYSWILKQLGNVRTRSLTR